MNFTCNMLYYYSDEVGYGRLYMALLTKKVIMATFEEMLSEMPFDKISVLALVKRSSISANTFYYHYEDKYALLNDWFSIRLKTMRDEMIGTKSLNANLKVFFMTCKNNPNLIYHIVDSLSKDELEHYMYNSTYDVFHRYVRAKAWGKGVPPEDLKKIAEYFSYSFIGFFLKFMWDGMQDDISDRVDSLSDFFIAIIEGAIKRYN